MEDDGYFTKQQGSNISIGWKQDNSYIQILSIFDNIYAGAFGKETTTAPSSGTAKYTGFALGAVQFNGAKVIKGTSNIDFDFDNKSVTGKIDFTDNPTYGITLRGTMETGKTKYTGTATVQGSSGTFEGKLFGNNYACCCPYTKKCYLF